MLKFKKQNIGDGIVKINAISFNIRNSNDPNGHSIIERAPRLNAATSRYNPDIICFQEYKLCWEPYVSDFYSDEYEIFIKYRDSSNDSEATPILWRKDKFECLDKGYFWLSDTPEVESKGWDELCDCHRICMYAVLKDKESNKIFTFMNTHFGFGDNGQMKSVNLIEEYSKKISSYPTFITGDFNMSPDAPAYALMIEKYTDINTVTANDLRTTYHGYTPESITDAHIDFCFISKDIIPVSQKIIDDTVDGKFPSDHYGIYIKMEI